MRRIFVYQSFSSYITVQFTSASIERFGVKILIYVSDEISSITHFLLHNCSHYFNNYCCIHLYDLTAQCHQILDLSSFVTKSYDLTAQYNHHAVSLSLSVIFFVLNRSPITIYLNVNVLLNIQRQNFDPCRRRNFVYHSFSSTSLFTLLQHLLLTARYTFLFLSFYNRMI